MKNKRFLAICILLALCLTACSSTTTCPPAETTGTQIVVCPGCTEVDANLSFADNLLHMTAGSGNRMLSPYSAKMCLALLANGARGETKQQILDAVGIADLDAYNAEVKALLARYASYAGVMSLETANSLWLNQTAFSGKGKFLTDYQTAMQEYFSAEVREVTSKNSVEEVNAWVNEKTHEKISDILTEEHRDFATTLVNAVYFKAGWLNKFEEHLTAKADFHNMDGTVSKIDFMENTESYGYFAKDGVQALQIDYGRFGGEDYVNDPDYSFSMYILLCDDSSASLNVDAFLQQNAPFAKERVKARIPKFELSYSVGLNDILKALGMSAAFDRNAADLGEMIDLSTLDGNLFVSDTLQKTYIKLDEEGTEAAAVTAIICFTTGALIFDKEPIEFTADKPFYFAIRDNTSGELLFVGRYETAE